MNEIKASDAAVSGQAERIPAALKAQQAVAHAVIHVTRKDTGKVDTYNLDFFPLPDDQQPKEA